MYELKTSGNGISLKPGTTAAEVVGALEGFLAKHDVEFHPMFDIDELEDMTEGSVPVFDGDCRFELTGGHLRLNLKLSTMPLEVPSIEEFKQTMAHLSVDSIDNAVSLRAVD